MGINIYIFIPSTVVGWKYCLKNPKSFFRSFSDRGIEKKHIEALVKATKYARECASHALVTCNKLHDENIRLKRELDKLKQELDSLEKIGAVT